MKKFIVPIYILLFTILVFYGLWHMYFQQDEWVGFGRVVYAQTYGFTTLIIQSGSHFTPLTTILMAAFYTLFSLDHRWYAWYSILLHAANGLLLYILADTLIKNKKAAILAATLFVAAAPSQQAVTWYAASLSFLPSAFFSLLGLLLFEMFLKIPKAKHLFLSMLCILIGAGFRENAIFLLAYVPIRSLVVRNPHTKKVLAYSCFFFGLYAIARFLPNMLFGNPLTTLAPGKVSLFTIALQAITFELLYLPKIIFPEYLSRIWLVRLFGPWAHFVNLEYLVHIFYAALWTTSAVILALLLRFSIKAKQHQHFVWSMIVFLVLSVLPFALLPPPLIMEPRHFYLSSVGFSLLVAYILLLVIKKSTPIGKVVLMAGVILYAAVNIVVIQITLRALKRTSDTKKTAVAQLASLFPNLQKQTLVLGTGDPLPFQTGTGNMLLLLYYDKQPYQKHLGEKFLQNLYSQGYKDIDGVGFGFFTDLPTLLTTYCQYRLQPENVLSFSWNGISQTLTDVSSGARAMLRCN